ncbi:replicative DNA helicase [Spiroplasma clarkii]|uniref:Replicative DNA helicase n=1 Tax=Spiroplasma clarkii TaxID=2139 RepID=A0A1Y0KYU1_9MOLU|nr:replicative DNA helicase [Spiroplasma clarkii]ARU90912.1 replicative DNA helicase [Spiroplasma clarkii]ATX70363.1 replicative DNA helicase [Spiroplasma clarkii]
MTNEFEVNSINILLNAEKYVLAVAMHSPKACFEIITQLEQTDFSSDAHSIIFETIQEVSQTGTKVSSATVINKLQENKLLAKIGGIEAITDINSFYITDEGFEDHIEVIFKSSMGRQLDRAIGEIKQLRDSRSPVLDVFMAAQQKIMGIRTEIKKDDAVPIKETVVEVIKKIDNLQNSGGSLINGIPSGFTDIDSITNGWQKGDFIILAARPSMGKTAFALNLATNAAKRNKGVVFFSLEMPKEQLVQRILASESTVDSNLLRIPAGLNQDKWKLITSAGDKIQKMNIVIDDTPGLNVMQIQSKLRKIKRDFEIEVCFIDYLQLISSVNNRFDSRQNEVAAISRQLKLIARELNIPVICLSQLSRSVEKREEKTPLMSDLRDSGAIEQDADIIMFLYREDYYAKREEYSMQSGSQVEPTDVIISKHRNGATGTVKVQFAKNCGKFMDQSKNN